jgi:hypothetical protein
MALGYIKGAEVSALSYYQALSAYAESTEQRKQIDDLIQDLKNVIAADQTKTTEVARLRGPSMEVVNFASSGSFPSYRAIR